MGVGLHNPRPHRRDRLRQQDCYRTCRIAGSRRRPPGSHTAWAARKSDRVRCDAQEIMLLLLDIGNTHTHIGLADDHRVRTQANVTTAGWFDGTTPKAIRLFLKNRPAQALTFCSVVPRASRACLDFAARQKLSILQLSAKNIRGIGIDYPKP